MAHDLPQDLPEETPEPARFTARQQKFIDAFCVSGNCTKAAKDAGYGEEYAYSVGSRLSKNVEIKAAIEERLAAYSISAGLATKLNSEIATTRLNDFFTIREVQGYEYAEQYVIVLAAHQRDEIAYIEEFANKQGIALFYEMTGPSEMGKRLLAAKEKLLEYELEVMHHGNEVKRLVPWKPALVKVAELDIVALAEAKEGGRLKSYSVGKDGMKAEMYAADAAIDRAARMHGLYEKDNKQLAGTEVIIIGGGSDPEAA